MVPFYRDAGVLDTDWEAIEVTNTPPSGSFIRGGSAFQVTRRVAPYILPLFLLIPTVTRSDWGPRPTAANRAARLALASESQRYVVVADVVDTMSYLDDRKRVRTDFVADVLEFLKGDATPDSTLSFSAIGGTHEGLRTLFFGNRLPRHGRRYLLFLQRCEPPGNRYYGNDLFLHESSLMAEISGDSASIYWPTATVLWSSLYDSVRTAIELTEPASQRDSSDLVVSASVDTSSIERSWRSIDTSHGTFVLHVQEVYKVPIGVSVNSGSFVTVTVHKPASTIFPARGKLPVVSHGETGLFFLRASSGDWVLGRSAWSKWRHNGDSAQVISEARGCKGIQVLETRLWDELIEILQGP